MPSYCPTLCLRGSAILEATHHNNTYTEEELAFALLTGKLVQAKPYLDTGTVAFVRPGAGGE